MHGRTASGPPAVGAESYAPGSVVTLGSGGSLHATLSGETEPTRQTGFASRRMLVTNACTMRQTR